MAQQAVSHSHVVLAHGSVLEAPAFAIVVDQLSSLAGEEQGFLVVLWGETGRETLGKGQREGQELQHPRVPLTPSRTGQRLFLPVQMAATAGGRVGKWGLYLGVALTQPAHLFLYWGQECAGGW